MKSPREARLEALLRRALEHALPGGLDDPEGCVAEGQWAEELFSEARRELANEGDVTMNSMTAIGSSATVDKPGDFAVTIRDDGEFMTIGEDGDASWIGEISLKQAAAGAAKTLVEELWKPSVSEAARAVALTRLYDRMDQESRVASLKGISGAKKTLSHFTSPSDDNHVRAIALLNTFDGMNEEGRRLAFETLILVGLDMSRKFGSKKG